MDLTKPRECKVDQQKVFIQFVKSLADENIKKKLRNTSEKCLETIDEETSLNQEGLEKLKGIFPGIVKRLQNAVKNKKGGGKRKSKKRHYKHIVKTKTIRKKNIKRRRSKKRDKINRRRSRK